MNIKCNVISNNAVRNTLLDPGSRLKLLFAFFCFTMDISYKKMSKRLITKALKYAMPDLTKTFMQESAQEFDLYSTWRITLLSFNKLKIFGCPLIKS